MFRNSIQPESRLLRAACKKAAGRGWRTKCNGPVSLEEIGEGDDPAERPADGEDPEDDGRPGGALESSQGSALSR